MDSGTSHRARRCRTAEVCRLCLKKRYLVDIDGNQYLCMQLKECFPHLSPDDSELPRFVCGECYQLVLEITYQFIIRTRRTEVLLRSYVHMGGDFPNQEALEAEYRRRPKRSASPEKDSQEEKPASKKRRSSEESSKSTDKIRSSKSKKDNERNSSKHREEKGKDSSKHRDGSKQESRKHKEENHKSNRSSSPSKRKEKDSMLPTKAMTEAELKRYYNSDEYLFGGAVDLEPMKAQNDRIEEIQPHKDAAIRMESVASNLKGISLKMSYEEMANVLTALQTIESSKKVSM
nr:stress response protein NST1-like [Aedes albopictus]